MDLFDPPLPDSSDADTLILAIQSSTKELTARAPWNTTIW